MQRPAWIYPLLLLLSALFFLGAVNACSPDMSERAQPTKKISQFTPPTVQPVAAPAVPAPEPLATPEIMAAPDILRVGYTIDVPPFIFHKNSKIQGIEADLALQLGISTGRSVHFIKVPEKRAIEALLQNQIDLLMSGHKISKAGDPQIAFSDPYLRAGQIMLIRTRDRALFSTGLFSLEQAEFTAGVIQGSIGEQFLTTSLRNMKVLRLKTPEAAIQALLQKKIDLFFSDAPLICYHAAISSPACLTPLLTLFTEEYMGWEMRKDDEELRLQVNQFIQQSRNDGQLQKTIKHWIPNL